MNLLINRDKLTPSSVLGTLVIDNTFFGYTLEDLPRIKKVYGKTCIPKGDYFVKVTYSDRFKKRLPLIYNDEHSFVVHSNGDTWSGVRFHGGNTELDTEGCILVAKNRYLNSPISFIDKLLKKIVIIKNSIQGSLSDKLTKKLDNGEIHTLKIL